MSHDNAARYVRAAIWRLIAKQERNHIMADVNDSRLTGAAADLLAALIELDAWALNDSGAQYPEGTLGIVRDAIAKAIGHE